MRKLTMFRRGLFLALTVAVGGLLISSCSKEDLNADRPIQKDLIQPETRGTDNRFLPGYLNGVEYGWYRTTRSLYPGITDKNEVEKLYDRFIVNGGSRKLTGAEGQGVIDATEAAIDAFIAYRK